MEKLLNNNSHVGEFGAEGAQGECFFAEAIQLGPNIHNNQTAYAKK